VELRYEEWLPLHPPDAVKTFWPLGWKKGLFLMFWKDKSCSIIRYRPPPVTFHLSKDAMKRRRPYPKNITAVHLWSWRSLLTFFAAKWPKESDNESVPALCQKVFDQDYTRFLRPPKSWSANQKRKDQKCSGKSYGQVTRMHKSAELTEVIHSKRTCSKSWK